MGEYPYKLLINSHIHWFNPAFFALVLFTQSIAAAWYADSHSFPSFFFICVILRERSPALAVWGGFMQGLLAYLFAPLTLYHMFKLVCEVQVLFDQ